MYPCFSCCAAKQCAVPYSAMEAGSDVSYLIRAGHCADTGGGRPGAGTKSVLRGALELCTTVPKQLVVWSMSSLKFILFELGSNWENGVHRLDLITDRYQLGSPVAVLVRK